MKLHLKPLNQQVIVITGGSSGIGLATARMAVEQGAHVALISRNEEALAQIEQQLSAGERVMHVVADVGEREQLQHAADCDRAFRRLRHRINNAGSSVWGRLGDVSDEDHQRHADQLLGHLLWLQHRRGAPAHVAARSST